MLNNLSLYLYHPLQSPLIFIKSSPPTLPFPPHSLAPHMYSSSHIELNRSSPPHYQPAPWWFSGSDRRRPGLIESLLTKLEMISDLRLGARTDAVV